MQRRTTRRQWIVGGTAIAGATIVGHVTAIEPRWLAVTEHDIPAGSRVRDSTIVQLSDLHMSDWGGLHDSLVEELRSHPADLLVFTGDLTEDAGYLQACEELLRRLASHAKLALAVSGNWEHWGGIPRATLESCYRRAGFRLLGNENLRLESGLVVVATDDACSGHAMPEVAMRNMPAGEFRLLLTHAAGWLEHANGPRFDLILAGHTHGGQVTLAGHAIALPPGSGPFASGWYETPLGRLYVNRGLGTSVIRARFGCRPELARFRLRGRA